MKTKLPCLLLAFSSMTAFANNISVSSVSLVNQNTTNKTVMVQFTVSWQNSWRVAAGPGNWDAAWVFVKFRVPPGPWRHAALNSNNNHVVPSGTTITTGLLNPANPFQQVANFGLGVFLYRTAVGNGTFTVTNAQIQWSYGVNGLADNEVVDVQVHGIEMVYVPNSIFAVGDGLSNLNQFTITTINTSVATTAPSGTGSLGGQAGGYPTGEIAPGSATWPNGVNAIYCMKYEVSQQGYVDFLNTLSRAQQINKVETDISSGITSTANRYVMTNTPAITGSRNGIVCPATFSATGPIVFGCDYDGDGIVGETSDGRELPANFLLWSDLGAYLDWASLRPITEMEFEKCARGSLLPFAGELAWGTTTSVTVTSVSNAGLPTEEPNSGANLAAGSSGPIRVGSIAGATSNREQAGAGYYGNMELSANLFERAITLDNVEGRAFQGSHGNGNLDASGNATNADWPNPSTLLGIMSRGGGWIGSIASHWTISGRLFGDNATRTQARGGRGARTAP